MARYCSVRGALDAGVEAGAGTALFFDSGLQLLDLAVSGKRPWVSVNALAMKGFPSWRIHVG